MHLPHQAWSATSCAALDQRDALASFWLAAPDDLLPSFWASPLGEATKALVRQLHPQSSFTAEQVALRNAIGERLQAGFQTPLALQLLLANWLYSAPGLMKIANPQQNLPAWLLPAYLELYEGQGSQAPVQQAASDGQVLPATQLPQPDFGSFPETLQELVGNRIQLNRMLGLSNLYYIDPEDQEILHELRQLRLQLINSILRTSEGQLEQLWATDLGDRYWAMVRSGVQNEALGSEEERIKEQVTGRLQPSQGGGFGTSGSLNAFLAAMLLFPPGSMRVDGAEQKIPGWLLSPYQEIFVQPLAAQA
ncbi:hypothetical protein [Cyanobium sp. WAJ14-Wanaka]|uniref:hypothetical protein n=1 Tax=Cyanobium sp. WAJ14-Wanaka TaxID=2823725 RepID=UPI0020CC9094|nr:hypothetical protein [Cyanobium sp. WAJ14-Wanaka]